MKTRCDRHYGLGPLFFAPEGGEGGAEGQPPAGGGAPAGSGTPPASGAPPTTPPEGFVPYERFKSTNDELQTLRREKEEREKADLTAKGEHEKVAEREKARAEAAEAGKLTIGRKAAFVAGASGKVTDVSAAYKLAVADGLLKDLALDDEGEPKDPKAIDAAVTELQKRYEFLRPADAPKDKDDKPSDFGAPAGGNGAPGGQAPKDARGMLRLGFEQSARRRE